MTACKSFAAILLTAEPSELRGEADTPLARHLATCEGCAAAARRILEDTRWLGQVLARPAPELDAEEILSRAERGPLGEASPLELPSPPTRPRLRHVGRIQYARRRWVTLAVAAGVTALLFMVRGGSQGPRNIPNGVGEGPAAASETLPTVESAPGHDVAVIPTGNPDVTVVWYF